MRRMGEDGRVSATVGREGADDGERASTSGLNPELTAGLVAEVRRGAPARSRGTRWGKVGEGSKSTKLSEVARAPPPGGKGGLAGLWEGRCGGGGCPAAVPAASWPPLAGAQVGGRQLPAPSSRHPRYLPGPPAKREEAESPWGRARNFAASGRARAGVRGFSCRRLELGEFLSLPALRRRGGRLPGRPGAGS